MTLTKAEWRERLLSARRAMDLEARRAASAAVVERLASLPAFDESQSILLYAAIGAELDPAALAALAWRHGKEVRQPASPELPPSWVALSPPAGIAVDAAADVRDPAVLVVVPGIGFDATGRRLGRGLGYYDRALAALRRAEPVTVVGVAYELQIVAELPHEPWDEPVDVIVTERRVLPCRATPSGAFGPARHRGGAR